MIFFEDFLKKIKDLNLEYKKEEKFRMATFQYICGILIAILLFLVAGFNFYLAQKQGNNIQYILVVVLAYLGIRQIKNISNTISINLDNEEINFKKTKIKLNEIKSCTLEEGKVGKKVQIMLNIITEENKQYLIPMFMNKKELFVVMMRDYLKEKFVIKKN